MKLRTVLNIYDTLNRDCFASRLQRPVVLFHRNSRAHGSYVYGGNHNAYMTISSGIDTGIREMTATVFHEMIHQYAWEVLGEHTDNHDDLFWLCYHLFSNFTFDWEDPAEYEQELTK